MNVEQTVLSILTKYVHVTRLNQLERSASLLSLCIDPLDRAYSFPMEVEERLGIEFSGDEIEAWTSVDDAVLCAERHLKKRIAETFST